MQNSARAISSSARVIVLATALFLSPTVAVAAPIPLFATLTGAQEVPANGSPGVGASAVLVDPALHTLQVFAVFAGLTGTTTAAHIHCCTPPGANAIVATQIPSFPGFPPGVTAGAYASAVFDLTVASTYNPAFIAAHGGTVASAEIDFVAALLAGLAYFNIHTSAFQNGEIRGQLAPAVPLPASLLLFGSAVAGFGLMMRKRRSYRTDRAAL